MRQFDEQRQGKLRIAVFEPCPMFAGGSERVALDLSRALAARRHRCFLTYGTSGNMLAEYEAFVARSARVDLSPFGWRTLGASLKRAWSLARLWQQWKIDVVFASDVQYLRLLALAGHLGPVRIVLHLGIENPLPYLSQRTAFRAFAAGVAPSAHVSERWRQAGWPAQTLHVVPNGVDIRRFHPAADKASLRARLAIPEGIPVIVYVGRLVTEKGLPTLLRAFATMRRRGSTALLVVVGSSHGGGVAPWTDEARLAGLPDECVRFVGPRSNPEDYLAAADLSVAPSEWDEPFGLSVIESMATGTVPVVSDRGVMGELVDPFQQELVFSAGQDDQLATRLEALLGNSEHRQRIGNALAHRARVVFGSDGVAAAYEQIMRGSEAQRPQSLGERVGSHV